jgi:hypothetical protein
MRQRSGCVGFGFSSPCAQWWFSGIVSVPCRYIHSPFSTCRLTDFDHTWRLLAAFCQNAQGVVTVGICRPGKAR